MDSPHPAVSDVSMRSNEEETRSSSVDPSDHSSEETIPIENPVVPQPLDHDALMAMDDEDREYACRYCNKKFTNKQALGGHQNAHKIERTLEKTARQAQENGLGYFGGPSVPHFFAPYHRSHDHMSRSYLNWPYPSPHHGLPMGHSSRPAVPMPVEPRPVIGFRHVWSAPLPRHPQFPGYRFPNGGEGSSSSVGPVSEHHQGLSDPATTLRLGPSTNPSASRMNEPEDQGLDESGLDLTLKL